MHGTNNAVKPASFVYNIINTVRPVLDQRQGNDSCRILGIIAGFIFASYMRQQWEIRQILTRVQYVEKLMLGLRFNKALQCAQHVMLMNFDSSLDCFIYAPVCM
jgi:hypothetical protein